MSLIHYTIDLETNGLKRNYHTVNEISIIRHTDRVQLSKRIKCKSPEKSSMDALRVTGKTMQDLMRGDENADVVNACNKFFNEDGLTPSHRCITGHNIWTFDRLFLWAMWEEEGSIFPASLYLDTLSMTKAWVKTANIGKQKTNLAAATELFGLKKISNAHSAKGDSRATYHLYNELIENRGIDRLSFIKNSPHQTKEPDPEFEPDLSILEDLNDEDMPF